MVECIKKKFKNYKMSTDNIQRLDLVDGKMVVTEDGKYLNANELLYQIDLMVKECEDSIKEFDKWHSDYNLQRIECEEWKKVALLQLKRNIQPIK